MAPTDELTSILERLGGKNEVYYYTEPAFKDARGIDNFVLTLAGAQYAADFTMLLRSLPAALQDHREITEVISGLISVVVQQQIQLNELTDRLESVVHANVALKAQESIGDLLTKLASQGSDVNKPEVTITIKGTSTNRVAESTNDLSRSSSAQSKSVAITGNVKTILQSLGRLRISADTKGSEILEQIDQLVTRSSASHKESYHGDVVIKFESITGSPLAHAKAEAIRRGIDSPNLKVDAGPVADTHPPSVAIDTQSKPRRGFFIRRRRATDE